MPAYGFRDDEVAGRVSWTGASGRLTVVGVLTGADDQATLRGADAHTVVSSVAVLPELRPDLFT